MRKYYPGGNIECISPFKKPEIWHCVFCGKHWDHIPTIDGFTCCSRCGEYKGIEQCRPFTECTLVSTYEEAVEESHAESKMLTDFELRRIAKIKLKQRNIMSKR